MSPEAKPEGFVVLLGAGPGDEDLVTVGGARWLSVSDVVVYDRLPGTRLLRLCRGDCRKIHVGKAPGRPGVTQQQINDLLIEHGRSGKLVVRLKGGDPLIFGRGAEEAQALREAGVDFCIVPGITAAATAAACAGVPLTDRRLASSVTLVTGHEDPAKEGSSLNWQALAGSDTLVLYMGVGTLKQTTRRLMEAGRDPATPVAIVERAGSLSQRTTTGTLETIADEADHVAIRAPAVVMVGQVVALRERIEWYERRALFGRTVLVTRPEGRAESMVRGLRLLGADVIEAPTIETAPLEDPSALDAALNGLEEQDWLATTSPNGVKAIFDRLDAIGGDARRLAPVKIAAVGSGTAQALAERGIRADLIPAEYTTEALGRALAQLPDAGPHGRRILLARADIATPVLPEILRGAGWTVSNVPAYHTRDAGCLPEEATQALRTGRVDWVTFTSASTVRGFLKLAKEADLSGVRWAAIGPITAEALRGAGREADVVASPHTPEALVEAIARASR